MCYSADVWRNHDTPCWKQVKYRSDFDVPVLIKNSKKRGRSIKPINLIIKCSGDLRKNYILSCMVNRRNWCETDVRGEQRCVKTVMETYKKIKSINEDKRTKPISEQR